ncbi:hypothetical protein AC579_10158 [Pseudocercospora musae]|uniref:Uncharacterized protein n=1 Tax=Pseudocercospora musae TaxID=113226 RepID=A0A139ISA3_9PEZI|nr:hypothetical protein AC579_10158 [Pseudocercospora musae]
MPPSPTPPGSFDRPKPLSIIIAPTAPKAPTSKMHFTKVIAVVASLAAGSAVAMPVPQLSGLTGSGGSLLAPVSGLTNALPLNSVTGLLPVSIVNTISAVLWSSDWLYGISGPLSVAMILPNAIRLAIHKAFSLDTTASAVRSRDCGFSPRAMQVRSALTFCLGLAHAGPTRRSEAIVARDHQPQECEQSSLNAVDPILTPQEVIPENFWHSADASIWELDSDPTCDPVVRDCHECFGEMVESEETHAFGDASLAVDKQGRCTKVSRQIALRDVPAYFDTHLPKWKGFERIRCAVFTPALDALGSPCTEMQEEEDDCHMMSLFL